MDVENENSEAPVVMDQADLNRRIFALQTACDSKVPLNSTDEFLNFVKRVEDYLKP